VGQPKILISSAYSEGEVSSDKIVENIDSFIRPPKKAELRPFTEMLYRPPVVQKPVVVTQYTQPVIKTQYRASTQPRNRAKWLLDLRTCESGGNYQRNSGNGYYGAYQFLIGTWNRMAVYNVVGFVNRPDLVGIRPDLASPADQDYMILKNTMGTAGLVSQNPGCYRDYQLENKPPEA
jgi:hypothetical protein